MNLFRKLVCIAAAGLVAACGGGGSDPYPPTSGGGDGTSTTASDLSLVLSSKRIANTGSDSVTATVTALDGNRNALADVKVALSVDSDAIVTSSGSTTDDAGVVTGDVKIGSNRSTRTITVTATSGSIKKTSTLQVYGSALSGTLVPAVVAPGTKAEVQFRLVDEAGNAMIGEPVTIVAPELTPSEATGVTGDNGDYTFEYTAPEDSGSFEVTASAGGTALAQTLQVQQASTIPNVKATIRSASVSANPSVVAVNTSGSTSNRAEVRALFLGSNNKPIKNVRVKFDLDSDSNSVGGTFAAGDDILYSDSNGVVTTAYIPGTRSSPTDGVTVRACYGVSDTDPALLTCSSSTTTTLTVTSEPLGVTIGTNEVIELTDLTYIKKLVVMVVDAAGVAKADVSVTASVDLPRYRTGFYGIDSNKWKRTQVAICQNEDSNRNGVLESGEDLNRNARLDPGKSDVSVRMLSEKTASDGTAILQIEYPKNYASWVDASVTVTAVVSGTEGSATHQFLPVPYPATALASTTTAPAFVLSPYGFGTCKQYAN